MNNAETKTVQTVAKDQTIEDRVRVSPVDRYELKARKRWGIVALIIILFWLLIALF
ncbi:hypothetical protein [Nitrosococcus watsonii]|uniref:Uncharacterized protein n=1 Tax=Nitrosococcus watsoni (strain C-113) TaxID=105559 RepID=D8K5Q9_NITWC|nr:hypothetical protein [Nitrosococcus watsonii]ADJ28236.1 hypothetical protein Nwat_1311 [Nitrosococcus watsonii C-113]